MLTSAVGDRTGLYCNKKSFFRNAPQTEESDKVNLEVYQINGATAPYPTANGD